MVKDALERRSGIGFDLEVTLPVRDPPRPHTFDFASPELRLKEPTYGPERLERVFIEGKIVKAEDIDDLLEP